MRAARTGALVAALAMAASAQVAGAQSAPVPPPTLVPNVLTVGLNLPSQGFQVGAVDGAAIVFARGLEVDLARAVARGMGLRGVRFVQEETFRGLVAPGAKRWDIAFGQVTVTAGRKRAVAFSVPYLTSDQGVLLRRGLPEPQPATLADLAALRLCVQRGTTGAGIVPRRIRPARPARPFDDLTDLMQAVQTGDCDAAVMDATILAVQRADTPERYGPMLGVIPTGERYAAVLPKGTRLLAAANRSLNALRRSGALDRVTARWLKATPAGLPVIPAGATGAPAPAPTGPVTPAPTDPAPPPPDPVPLP